MKNLLKGLLIMLSISLGTMTLMFTKANEEPIDPEEGKVETEDVSPRDIYIGNTFIDEEGNVVIEEEQAEMPVSKTRSTKAISYPGFLDLRALSTSKTIKLYTSSTSNTGYAVFNPGSANIIPVYSKSNNRYKVNVNGRIGWMSASSGIVELTPSQLISKKYDSYFINTSKGDLAYSYMYYGKRSSFIVGEKLSFLTTGVKYYSTDGIYFYDSVSKMLAGNTNSAVNKGTPYYNYYQYLPIRSASKLTASDFIKFLNSKGYTSSNSVMATSSAANAFIKAQGSYGINAAIEFSMGILESGYGTSSLAKNKNNLFGWGAVDNNPTNGAFKFSSVAAGIDYHANNGMSAGYLDTKYDYRYFGANLGNKNNGLNVKYASDPYWGMKIAGIYYKVDQYSGFKDKDFYQIGIKTSSEDPMIYYGSNPVYRFKNNKVNLKITNMPFVVLKNEGKGKYKFLSDSPIYNSGDALKYQKISGSTIYWRICSQIPSCASIKVGDAYFASTYRFNQDIVTSTFNSVKLIGSNVPRNPNDKINDGDNDGVIDGKDKCPSTPVGTNVNADGCAFGSEYNAVINVNSLEVQVYSEQANRNVKSILSPTAVDFDGKDLTSKIVVVSDGGYDYKVEGTYKVKFSVVGENGIVVEKVVGLITTPEPDNDKDGVVDRLDKCPSTPEGTTVDANGCAFGSEYNATIEATDKQVQATTPAARKDVLGIINPTAVDFDGRDISNLVKIANDGNYNSEVAGMYKITLSVIGENGITVNKINYIMVTPEPDNDNDGIGNSIDQCPNTSEEYVENVDETGCVSGEKFNALIGVTLVEVTANSTLAKKDVMTILDPRAFDYDGRDITSKIVLVSNGGYDYSKMGEYTVTFAVTGENRIKVETKVVIKVLSEIDDDKDGVGNSLDKCPSTQEGFEVSSDGCVTGEKYNAILTASDKVVLENSSASKMDVLSIINAKAEDYDGSDLTGEIKLVNSGEYKSSVPGTYVITVSVTGENKIAVTKNFKITVERDYSNNASKIVEEYVKNSNSEEFRSRNVVDETKETFEMLMEIQKSTSFENFLEITQLFKTR